MNLILISFLLNDIVFSQMIFHNRKIPRVADQICKRGLTSSPILPKNSTLDYPVYRIIVLKKDVFLFYPTEDKYKDSKIHFESPYHSLKYDVYMISQVQFIPFSAYFVETKFLIGGYNIVPRQNESYPHDTKISEIFIQDDSGWRSSDLSIPALMSSYDPFLYNVHIIFSMNEGPYAYLNLIALIEYTRKSGILLRFYFYESRLRIEIGSNTFWSSYEKSKLANVAKLNEDETNFQLVRIDDKQNIYFSNWSVYSKENVSWSLPIPFYSLLACPVRFSDLNLKKSIKGIHFDQISDKWLIFIEKFHLEIQEDLLDDQFKLNEKIYNDNARSLRFEIDSDHFNVFFPMGSEFSHFVKNRDRSVFLTLFDRYENIKGFL